MMRRLHRGRQSEGWLLGCLHGLESLWVGAKSLRDDRTCVRLLPRAFMTQPSPGPPWGYRFIRRPHEPFDDDGEDDANDCGNPQENEHALEQADLPQSCYPKVRRKQEHASSVTAVLSGQHQSVG